jgi:hypothetical protein
MPASKRQAVNAMRRRRKRQGIVRLEVNVRRSDVPLLRGVAEALGDPKREAEIRALLRDRLAKSGALGFKAFLAAAPLEGVELMRDRRVGRDVEL